MGSPPHRPTRIATVGIVAASVLMTSVAWAASDDDDEYKKEGWTEGITTSIQDSFQGAAKRLGLNRPPLPPPAESSPGCPTIALLPGTEAQRSLQPGASGNVGVRYQYSLFNVGRECTVSGNRVAIKVGADGRVLLGPAGTAGRFDVPIRIAVFSEAQRKAVESRLFKVPVQLGGGRLRCRSPSCRTPSPSRSLRGTPASTASRSGSTPARAAAMLRRSRSMLANRRRRLPRAPASRKLSTDSDRRSVGEALHVVDALIEELVGEA